MTRRILTLLSLATVLLSFKVSANDDSLRSLLTRDLTPECELYQHNARLLIPRLHQSEQMDSVTMILGFIDSICGENPFKEYRLLRRIDSGDNMRDWCDSVIVRDILNLRPYWMYPRWFYYEPRTDTSRTCYNTFISGYAARLAEITDSNSVAHLLCRYYSSDLEYIINKLADTAYAGTCLQDAYNARIHDIEDCLSHGGGGHFAAIIGVWNPLGKAELLGPKLVLGGELGVRGRHFGFDLTLAFRFLKARDEYIVQHEGNLVTTDDFLGGFIGGTFVYRLARPRPVGIELFSGIAYDGFDAYYEDDSDDAKTINSFNLNTGLTLQYRPSKRSNFYIGLRMRYNVVNYDTGGGTDLSGNTLSFNLLLGVIGNSSAVRQAKRLGYYR